MLMNSAPTFMQVLRPWAHPRSFALLPGPCLDPKEAKVIWFFSVDLGLGPWPPLSEWLAVMGICSPGPWASHSLSRVLAPARDGQGRGGGRVEKAAARSSPSPAAQPGTYFQPLALANWHFSFLD